MASDLDAYVVFVKLTVMGENPNDALEYVTSAVDNSDLLEQDGVIGIEVVDDIDTIELADEEEDYGYDDDEVDDDEF